MIKVSLRQNWLKWVIPFLALVVIGESLVVVDYLTRIEKKREKKQEEVGVAVEELKPAPRAVAKIQGDEQLSLGEEGVFKVVLRPLEDLKLDAIDLVIEYDPEFLEILDVDEEKEGVQVEVNRELFSFVGRNWVQADKKRIIVSFLELEKEGVNLPQGEEVWLVGGRFLAKKAGETQLRVLTDDIRVGSKLVESQTALKVPLRGEELRVRIEE